MPTRIASVEGIHPYFLGTDIPIGVDATGTKWAISFQGRNAVLLATFASGVTLQFTIPTTSTAGSKSGSVASFGIPNFGDARWTTYAESVKFEVTFPTAPKVTSVSVNLAKQNADLVSDGNGGLDVVSAGVKVGALPRPFIDYVPDGKQDRTRVWLDWVVSSNSMTLALPTLSASEWVTAVLDPTVITTSTASTATAYSNQRKIDRCQNGVLWTMFWDGTSTTTTSMRFWYSTDNGATWVDPGASSKFGFTGTSTTYTPNVSLFIDVDDYAHVVYKDRHDGFIYYRRGTPNAARTAWTWSASVNVMNTSTTAFDYPDTVAHREGTGWKAHIVASRADTTAQDRPWYNVVTIDSTGTVTAAAAVTLSSAYGSTLHTYPSIDFNHTGDGKTVAGGTPHLYAAWSAGATGAGKGIRFKKATYSGGAWAWGTEVEIDNTAFANAGRISSAFDGSRAVIAFADSAATSSIKVFERDAADTTTTTRTPTALSDGVVSGLTVSYKANGDMYLGAIGATSVDPKYLIYNRAGNTWGAWTALAATTAQADTLSAHRGGTSYVYTDGTASPYNIQYAKFSTGLSAAVGVAAESEAPLSLGKKKRLSLGISLAANTAIGLARLKFKLANRAAESGSAMPITTGLHALISQALETGAALPLGVSRRYPLRQAIDFVLESSFARALGVVQSYLPRGFTPEVLWEPMPTSMKPYKFFKQPVSFAVVFRNGHFQSVRVPTQDETAALVEGETWFTGGRSYVVSHDTAILLESDGFTTTTL